jgi:hypothetical protein
VDDVRVQMLDGRVPSREDGRATALQRLHRAQAQVDADVRTADVSDADDEIRDGDAERVQIRAQIVGGSRDEDARGRRYGRNGGAAAVEHDDVRIERARELGACCHVRVRHCAGEASSRAAAADRRDAGERRRLEMVGRSVAPGAREGEQLVDARLRLHELRLWGSPAAHGHDDDAAVAREQPRDVRRDGGLADALAGPDDRQRRQVERLQPWRLEAEVGADVRQSEHERARREPEALRRRQHRLIGEVNHDVSFDSVEPVDERDAVVLSSAQLLGAADEQCADELVLQCCERVAHHGRVVLPIDDCQRPHDESPIATGAAWPRRRRLLSKDPTRDHRQMGTRAKRACPVFSS